MRPHPRCPHRRAGDCGLDRKGRHDVALCHGGRVSGRTHVAAAAPARAPGGCVGKGAGERGGRGSNERRRWRSQRLLRRVPDGGDRGARAGD
eukprot:354818-Chlamydomonas_euryale.AAC.1